MPLARVRQAAMLAGGYGKRMLPLTASLPKPLISVAGKPFAERLAKSQQWDSFALRDFDFSAIDEYRELDDDITPQELMMYRLNRAAVQELREQGGIQKIERDSAYPEVLFFVGGMVGESSYGYLHAATPHALPNVWNHNVVMLKPVAPQWWLYKRVEDG
ncbi:MAG: hypothetical protein DYG96_14445 [Chlorobi bacterium CHB2]|nr:hypothetical protein [Chlorobi bacterium CHB2]